MDGTEVRLIVNTVQNLKNPFNPRSIMGFDVSSNRRRIFFGNRDKEIIESVDYIGKRRVKVASAKNPMSITVEDKDNMVWTDFNEGMKFFSMKLTVNLILAIFIWQKLIHFIQIKVISRQIYSRIQVGCSNFTEILHTCLL